MSLPTAATTHITDRAAGRCELCAATDTLEIHAVTGGPAAHADAGAALCGRCRDQIAPGAALDGAHLRCLQGAAWSPEPPIQVLSLRLLRALDTEWARDLRGQIWVEDDIRAWAEAGGAAATPAVVDSNGTPLADGDAVTLIKDLVVKGGGFTAKRGTLVKNIRLGDDPTHIEGRVQKQTIMLKTAFLKRAGA